VSKNTLIVITRDPEVYRGKLTAAALPDLEVVVPASPQEIKEHIGRATIMLAEPPLAKQYINDAKNVVWMQSIYAGVDSMNAEGVRKDYVLTNVRDVYGEAMAEYTFAYILAFKKEIPENLEYQKEKVWKQRPLNLLQGETLCVLGAGSIGKHIARIGKAFGMRTLGYHTSKRPVEFFDEMFTGDELKDFLSRGDYVVSVLPNTSETDDLINTDNIAAMKETALFMNIGRGNAVNEDDIVTSVKEKRIAKAVLDVFKKEPLPPESQLWSTDNIYLTPHMAGYIITDKIFEIFVENYHRFTAGEELKYRIDFTKGY
jgi:phosphoglycerate dehydrogenase-like enzyme